MFRKLMIAAAATVSLGAAALSPTAASAGWHGFHGGHGFWRGGLFIRVNGYGPDCNCYLQRRIVMTRYGERRGWVRYCY